MVEGLLPAAAVILERPPAGHDQVTERPTQEQSRIQVEQLGQLGGAALLAARL
jgi:hypothetical protein